MLKGAPFEKLVGKTSDGLRIEPIYRRAPGAAPIAGRAAAAPWQIMQRIDHPDAAQANAQALHDLENGATGLTLVFAGGQRRAWLWPASRRRRRSRRLLDGVFFDAGIAIELQSVLAVAAMAGDSCSPNYSSARASIRPRATSASASIRSAPARCGVAAPTAGTEIVHGRSPSVHQAASPRCGFKGPFALADGRVIHDAGGSEAQELAFVLAVAASPICARWKRPASRSKTRSGMIYAPAQPPMPISS